MRLGFGDGCVVVTLSKLTPSPISKPNAERVGDMNEIDTLMLQIASALPETSSIRGNKTIRDVALHYSGEWHVMAGGHSAVDLGEWGGDFDAWGSTALDALHNCLEKVKAHASTL
jgi:hypothetical protein